MVVLVLAAAALAAATSALPLPASDSDALVLVQRSLKGSQAAERWQSRLSQQASSFQVGSSLEFRVAGSHWANCTVVAQGDKPDTYTIHVPALPFGQQDLTGVHALSLRDPQKESAKAAARLQAERKAAEEKQQREAKEAVLFEDNEDVLVRGTGKGGGKWFHGRIYRHGSKPGTYDVGLFSNGLVIRDTKAAFIKKTHEMHYETCEAVEFKGADNIWRRSKVLGPGSDVGLVNLRHPGSATAVLRDIPVLILRRVPKAKPTGSAKNATTSASMAKGTSLADAGAQAMAAEPAVLLSVGQEGLEAEEAGEESGAQMYKAGQPVWVQLVQNDESKPWVQAQILSEGELPSSYNVRVTVKIPNYDLCDVPAERLRETEESRLVRAEAETKRKAKEEERQRAAQEEAKRKEEEAAQRRAEQEIERQLDEGEARAQARQQAVIKVLSAAAYRPGQELQFNTQGSQWVNCTIFSLAVKPRTYNIYVPSFPEGLREISDVNGKALRSFEEAEKAEQERKEAPKRFMEEAKAKLQRAHTFEPTERVQVQVKGTNNTWAEAVISQKGAEPEWYLVEVEGKLVNVHSSTLRRDPEHTFEDGETVEIRSKTVKDAWVPCTVTRRGEVPGTYNVYFTSGPIGHRDMHNLDARALRRMKFSPGQPVEVYMRRGPSKGMWVESEITGLVADKPDSYSVRVFDTPEYNISTVAYRYIRRSEAEAERWRLKLQQEAQIREEERLRKERQDRENEEWIHNHTFEDGERVQVLSAGKERGAWINVTVIGQGTTPDTYTLLWRNEAVFKNVRRENIRKDPESQALKLQAEEATKKQVEEEEAARHAVVLARAKRVEEAQRKADERERKLEEASLQGEAAAIADDDVERVSDEELARLVAMTESVVKKEQEHQQEELERKKKQAQEEQHKDEEDFAARQAEWEAALRADEQANGGEAQVEAPAAPAEAPKQEPSPLPPSSSAELPAPVAAAEAAKEPPKEQAPAAEEGEKGREGAPAKKAPAAEEGEKGKRGAPAKKAPAAKEKKEAEQPKEPAEVTWSMDAETAKRQAEWEAMVAEEEQNAAEEAAVEGQATADQSQ